MSSSQSSLPISPQSIRPGIHCSSLPPITDYYTRKLFRENILHLVPTRQEPTHQEPNRQEKFSISEVSVSSTALFNQLRMLHSDFPAVVQSLNALVLRHQTLRTQGGKYQFELQQVASQIFDCFGLKCTQAIAQAKILVIDDTLETLKLLTDTLMNHGYAVKQFSNSAAALNDIKLCQPDLILLDIMMPGIDGYEVCDRLKLDPLTSHIPVIFLSAIGTPSYKVKAFDMGGVDYVTKPFQLEEVLARVEYQLKIYQLHQRSQQEQEAAETYQAFFENAVEGMFQSTLNGQFLRANQALATLLGYDSPDDLIESVQDIARQLYTIPQRRIQFVLYLEQYQQTQDFEAEVFCKNGDRIWIRETARAVRDAEGTLRYYQGTIQDITAHKKLELLQAQQEWNDSL
jgi:PAS domain S-box-containing protein